MRHADGRGLKKPVVSRTETASHVTYRIDDDANPAFWLDLRLSRDEVRQALEKMDVMASEAPTTEVVLTAEELETDVVA